MKHVIKIIGILALLVAATLIFAKPYAADMIDLPGSVDALSLIWPIDSYSWQNVNLHLGWNGPAPKRK